MNAFDADCLIYAAELGHRLGDAVYDLLTSGERAVGSVMLLPELLIKPMRTKRLDQEPRLLEIIGQLDLVAVDDELGRVAVALGAKYGLRAVDSVHLATAVAIGADRFVTNNRRDFSPAISEVHIVYPGDL